MHVMVGGMLPFVRPFLRGPVARMESQAAKLKWFLQQEINRKTKQYEPSNEPGDFIESYLREMEKDTEGKYTESNLLYTLSDLFAAGMETVSTTLSWGVLFMMLHPDIQDMVQEEIDQIIGRDRVPSWTDRSNLPYAEATLLEIQRRSSVATVQFRSTRTDTTLAGYTIPKGYDIVINYWSINTDPTTYPSPEKFDPGRFLTADGKVQKLESFMPFGAGRRVCMGESLAKMELFLFFVTMLQQFTFSIPEGSPPPSTKGEFNFVNMPVKFNVLIKRRI